MWERSSVQLVTFLCDVALDFTCTQNRWQIGILYYFPRVCFELLYFYSPPNLLKLKFYKLFVHCNHGVYFPVTVFHNDQELKENVIKYTHVDFKISSNKYLFPLFFFFFPQWSFHRTRRGVPSQGVTLIGSPPFPKSQSSACCRITYKVNFVCPCFAHKWKCKVQSSA